MEHLASLSRKIQMVWPNLGRVGGRDQFVLVGGSAMALQIGHRESVDVDLVSSRPCPHPRTLRSQLGIDGLGAHKWIRKKRSHYIKFRETETAPKIDVHGKSRMPCLEVPKRASNGLRIASLTDILFQKLLAASDRRAERDGVDLLVLFGARISVSKALDAFAAAAGPEDMERLAWSFRHPEKMSWPSSSRWARFARQLEEHEPGGLNPSHRRIEGPEWIEPLTPAPGYDPRSGRLRTL